MKKVVKISLVAIAALLFFLNVSLNLDGNKVEGLSLTSKAQIAQAEGQCYMHPTNFYCYCMPLSYYCVATCWEHAGYDCNEVIIEGK